MTLPLYRLPSSIIRSLFPICTDEETVLCTEYSVLCMIDAGHLDREAQAEAVDAVLRRVGLWLDDGADIFASGSSRLSLLCILCIL